MKRGREEEEEDPRKEITPTKKQRREESEELVVGDEEHDMEEFDLTIQLKANYNIYLFPSVIGICVQSVTCCYF